MIQPERNFSAWGDIYRYGFNGKEKSDEMHGEGNIYDYGFRIYNPRLGKFLSVDPLSKSYPWNSTYAYAENDVIQSIDLDGLEKYKIHQRSFAPWQLFGEIATGGKYAYSGDNRGFSLANDNQIKSKVVVNITVDIATAKAVLTFAGQSGGGTERYSTRTWNLLKVAEPVIPSVSMTNPQVAGSLTTLRQRIEGKAPLAPHPWLDWASSFIDEPIVWTGTTGIDNHITQGYINVSYKLTGKGFPAFESFLEDAKGTKIFIGYYVSPGKTNIVQALSGSELAYSKTINTKIQTDEQGNFLGVFAKDKNGKEIVMMPSAYNAGILNTYPAKDLPENKINIEQLQENRAIQETWNGIIQF